MLQRPSLCPAPNHPSASCHCCCDGDAGRHLCTNNCVCQRNQQACVLSTPHIIVGVNVTFVSKSHIDRCVSELEDRRRQNWKTELLCLKLDNEATDNTYRSGIIRNGLSLVNWLQFKLTFGIGCNRPKPTQPLELALKMQKRRCVRV